MYPVGRSRFHAVFLAGLWLAGLALVIAWGSALSRIDWRVGLVGVTIIVSGVAAFLSWKNAPIGQLSWDGQCWHWEDASYLAGIEGQCVSVVADFQNVVLLRMVCVKQAKWLWMERKSLPDRWMDFRRAVYSPLNGNDAEADAQPFEPIMAASVDK